MYNEIKFAIDGDPNGKVFKGKDLGQRWNGWLVPLVTDAVHQDIIAWMEESASRCEDDPDGSYRELMDQMKDSESHHGTHTHFFGLCWAIVY